jgi:hypothetical protein
MGWKAEEAKKMEGVETKGLMIEYVRIEGLLSSQHSLLSRRGDAKSWMGAQHLGTDACGQSVGRRVARAHHGGLMIKTCGEAIGQG